MCAQDLPFTWDGAGTLSVNGVDYGSTTGSRVPQLIYPSPFASGKYVLVNSGTTFREGHDTTNSLQNAKLPDWAVIDFEQAAPSETASGAVVAAGAHSLLLVCVMTPARNETSMLSTLLLP